MGARNGEQIDRKALKRLAMQLAVQLPEDRREALIVLQYCERLVVDFIEDADAEPTVSRLRLVRSV